MLTSTVGYLCCPNPDCKGDLSLSSTRSLPIPVGDLVGDPAGGQGEVSEIVSGNLTCKKCRTAYPILQGVAVLVEDVKSYLLEHVKGVSRWVPDLEIPKGVRSAFQRARSEIETEYIEEDLEAVRVTSLYVMNHFLKVQGKSAWWKEGLSDFSPEIEEIIQKYWDKGPFTKIQELWGHEKRSLVELGCGVGGLYNFLKPYLSHYLGVDSSFASIALARQLALGLPAPLTKTEKIEVPGDLLNGIVSNNIRSQIEAAESNGRADFVVGDAIFPPLKAGDWDASASLNMIDMLNEPQLLVEIQKSLVRIGGLAIQSSPYVWPPDAAKNVKKMSSKHDSASAVEQMYETAGFKILSSIRHIPWLFFKHARQLEIYSVHLFFSQKMF